MTGIPVQQVDGRRLLELPVQPPLSIGNPPSLHNYAFISILSPTHSQNTKQLGQPSEFDLYLKETSN